jgi:hypothetical protein
MPRPDVQPLPQRVDVVELLLRFENSLHHAEVQAVQSRIPREPDGEPAELARLQFGEARFQLRVGALILLGEADQLHVVVAGDGDLAHAAAFSQK